MYQDLKEHIKLKHQYAEFPCNPCGKTFQNYNAAREHRNKFHCVAKFSCGICEYQAPTKISLSNHIKFYHSLLESQQGQKVVVDLKCTECNLSFESLKEHMKHQVIIHNSHPKKVHPCPKCDHVATQAGNLLTHMKNKHEGIKFECDECKKIFNFAGTLKQHKNTIHLKMRYPCNLCHHKASSPSCLSNHKRNKHSKQYMNNLGVKGQNIGPQVVQKHPYACDFCDYSTSLKFSLTMHIESKHLK